MFTPRTSKSGPDSPTPHLPPGKFVFSRGRLIGVGVLGGLVGASAVGLALTAITGSVARPTFPSAANSGVPATTTLKAVPSQVSSGPGWSYNAGLNLVEVSGSNVVLSGLSIPCNLDITGSHVTINDDKVTTGGYFGITLRHTADVTIENTTISGLNATTGRLGSAIDDSSGDSTGMVVKGNNISDFKSAVQLTSGLVTGNYIHDPGYISGDHTNGVIANGGTGQLTISGNTILNSISETDAITLDTSTVPGTVSNKTIENNLLGGGDYAIYGGTAFGHTTSNIVIANNRFSQAYYPKSGQFGPVAYFSPSGAGNSWTSNVWDTTGQTIPAP
jgi:hypothetical protein